MTDGAGSTETMVNMYHTTHHVTYLKRVTAVVTTKTNSNFTISKALAVLIFQQHMTIQGGGGGLHE